MGGLIVVFQKFAHPAEMSTTNCRGLDDFNFRVLMNVQPFRNIVVLGKGRMNSINDNRKKRTVRKRQIGLIDGRIGERVVITRKDILKY